MSPFLKAQTFLAERVEDCASLLVDVRRDSLDSTCAGQSADSRLSNAKDTRTESSTTEVHSLGADHVALNLTTAGADLSSNFSKTLVYVSLSECRLLLQTLVNILVILFLPLKV